jgi:hypothetical protein
MNRSGLASDYIEGRNLTLGFAIPMSMIYLFMMVDSRFDIAVLVVALILASVVAIFRWPWWLPVIVAPLATIATQEGGDINFWLIGFPAYVILLYAVYGLVRAIIGLRPRAQG